MVSKFDRNRYAELKKKARSGLTQQLFYTGMWGKNAHEYHGFWIDDEDSRCFSSDSEVDEYEAMVDLAYR